MTGHELSTALTALCVALLLYHLRAHAAIDRDLAELKPKIRTLWARFINEIREP